MVNKAFALWSHFSQNELSNTYGFFAGATFCVLLSRIDTQKVPRAFVKSLERCGLLDGQMAKVDPEEVHPESLLPWSD
jgi:hypothetical protein